MQFCREHSWKDIGVHGSAFLVGCVSHSGADLILNHESYDQKELWTQIGRSTFDCALLGTAVGGGVTAARAASIGKELSVAKTVANETRNVADLVKLNKSLASRQQMGEFGQIMAGPGGRVPFRDAQRVAQQYGGKTFDWVKKTSPSYTSGGTTFETHWIENIRTGQRVEFKTKLPGRDPS